MERIIRINNIEDQDDIRRAGTAKLTPNERLAAVLELQANTLRWDLNPGIVRTLRLRRLNFKNVE